MFEPCLVITSCKVILGGFMVFMLFDNKIQARVHSMHKTWKTKVIFKDCQTDSKLPQIFVEISQYLHPLPDMVKIAG